MTWWRSGMPSRRHDRKLKPETGAIFRSIISLSIARGPI
jgi:hypothetical protein